MRTTLDLPDPVFRDLKTKAARDGVTLKELVKRFVEKGLYEKPVEKVVVRSPLPEPLRREGRALMPALTNAEIEEIFFREDLERSGYDLSAVKGSLFGDTP
ncbi:hypothetical protein [Luteolibacter sp. Populi]|uniref:hypothetical protein n=1 Tax=Luteolibacter sp. Populi TaxID=3230487 RepID=UPI0034650F5C